MSPIGLRAERRKAALVVEMRHTELNNSWRAGHTGLVIRIVLVVTRRPRCISGNLSSNKTASARWWKLYLYFHIARRKVSPVSRCNIVRNRIAEHI
jgi:hypothetical protein